IITESITLGEGFAASVVANASITEGIDPGTSYAGPEDAEGDTDPLIGMLARTQMLQRITENARERREEREAREAQEREAQEAAAAKAEDTPQKAKIAAKARKQAKAEKLAIAAHRDDEEALIAILKLVA